MSGHSRTMVESIAITNVIPDAHTQEKGLSYFLTLETCERAATTPQSIGMNVVMCDITLEEREQAIRTGPRLDGLPGEILCMIAREMTNKELRQFREVYNRHITHHIDHVFAEAHFQYRVCKITNRSVNRLERLRGPRFLKHIRTIDFRLDLQCRVRRPAEKLFPEPEGLHTTSLLNEAKFFAVIESVVRQAPKLRAITIRAPSSFVYTQEGVYIPRSMFLNGSEIRNDGLLRTNPEGVQSSDSAWHVRDFVSQLVRRIQVALPCLEGFRVVGFAESEWQSNLASARTILEEMAFVPTLRHLNTLDLQLEMFPQEGTRCLSNLVKITERSANLKVLRIRSGPNVDKNYRMSSEKWAPLLRQLGVNPPFRLETLDIDGLVTSKSAPTLDQIINAHSPTLRRLILEHTNFHYPNTLRAFFYALADSNVNYYRSNWLYLHQRTMLVASTLSFLLVTDEVLHSNLGEIIQTEDMSSWDWVHITWDIREGLPLVYDNHDGWWGKDWMRDCFLSTISSINSGAIRDS